ncbi:helix-turn-helix domain-containing protein [Leptospira wolffii]|uniref:Helix-turn-helix domain-containing protein n=1 Tax=Leptospira wolffii TaxID=409998 RepID=A0ABV5BJQ0_9LEPT|nr:helix-turn-helix transcriptional regulator [Leptospira wolffii]TGL49243.1 XRE family transcriptional regulator [Leptospira wolffii]
MAKSIFTEEYKAFQKLLRKAREESGLTQTDVANALKAPQSFISKVEAGDRRIDVIEFWNLAKLYRKPVEFFFRFEEKETSKSKSKTLKVASSKKKSR